jgi:hypothetical protein
MGMRKDRLQKEGNEDEIGNVKSGVVIRMSTLD